MRLRAVVLFLLSFVIFPGLFFVRAAPAPALSVQVLNEGGLQLNWPASATDFALEQSDALGATTVWSAVAAAPQLFGELFSVTVQPAAQKLFYRLRVPLVTIRTTSPLDGETGVAVTRETIIYFNHALATASTLAADNFYAGFGGRRILSRIELSSDRTRASLFYLEPLPGSAHINVVFDGKGLTDEVGQPVDAEGDGLPGGMLLFGFDTLNLTPLVNTGVIGTVYASELVPGGDTGTNAVNKPLAGVTITVDGMEETLRAVTDANGNFSLNPAPPGRFFVHIDGRTVTNLAAGIRYPDHSYYPYVGKAWDATAGKTNSLAGGTGTIYLPLIKSGTLQPVSMTQDTSISFPASVIAANPALAGVSITVPANSLFNDNGTRGGKVGIAPVPPDRLPGPLPPGAEVPIVITVQTDGALNFDKPAPVCFPNLPNPTTGKAWPAGAKGSLISFNHKKGVWEPVGDMTVSADGSVFCTDPGVGILQPGWHSVYCPKAVTPPPPAPRPGCRIYIGDPGEKMDDICIRSCTGIFDWELEGLTSFIQSAHVVCDSLQGDPAADCNNAIYVFANRRRAEFYTDDADCKTKCIRCFTGRSSDPINPVHTRGLDSSIEEKLVEIQDQIAALISPYVLSRSAYPPPVVSQIAELEQQANTLAGGSAADYLKSRAIDAEQNASRQARAAGIELDDLLPGNAPPYPVLYAATVSRPTGLVVLRGETGPFGQYSLYIAADGTLLDISFYDPKTRQFASILPHLSPDAPYGLPRFTLHPLEPDEFDFDRDGLPDLVEYVLGTDPANPDTDGDGIPDGAEVEQGTNPLDGFVVQTGVIAGTKTPGPALDIWTGNGLVATAEGAGGVSILSVYDGSDPTILAHVPTAFPVARVAGVVNSIVAAGPPGLAIIDVTTPTAASITGQVPLPDAQAVTADGATAWVGSASGQILAVNLPSGAVTATLALSNAVVDLAVEGNYLYALTGDRLYVISIANGSMSLVSSALSPFVAAPNQRVFVGGGIAYTVHRKGYNTIDISDAANPTLLAAGQTTLFGWKQLVANGSGLGLAAVGPNSTDDGPHDVSLYDLSNPQANNVFITTFQTPDISRALSIYDGLAYVACDSAGVQVINYLPYDNKRKAPAISLSTTLNLAGLTGVEEGKPAGAVATVTDDVQVRNVEFYIDGVKTFTDAAFPFEFRFITPPRTGVKTNFVLQARAIDTGGNATWSEQISIALVADGTPPKVSTVSPVVFSETVNSLLATFNEPIAPGTLNSSSFQVFSHGPEGSPSDEIPLPGGIVGYDPNSSTATLSFAAPVPGGYYRAVIRSNVTDLAGNHLAADYVWNFGTGEGLFWIHQGTGFWDDPLNWSTGAVPGPDDNVVIDVSPAVSTVIFRSGTVSIKGLVSNEPITMSGGTLHVSQIMALNRDFTLDGGTLSAIVFENGGKLICTGNPFNTLDAVTINGDLDLSVINARAAVKHGFTLNGTAFLSNSGSLGFVGDQTLTAGTFVFGDAGVLSAENATTLTLSSNVVIRGKTGLITPGYYFGGQGSVVNQGRISADTAGGSIRISTSFDNQGLLQMKNGGSLILTSPLFTNPGSIDASGGGALDLAGSWSNTGIITATGVTLNLGGAPGVFGVAPNTFSLAQLGSLHQSGSVFSLIGTLDLAGGTLNLDKTSGTWVLNGGIIKNGSITETGSGKLVIPANSASTLDGVTVNGDLDMTAVNALLVVKNGLTLHGAARLNDGATLGFRGTQTLDTGEIIFGPLPAYISLDAGAVLTLGSAAVVHGKNGNIIQGHVVGGTGELINNGVISVDVPGGEIDISESSLTNTGTLEANGAGARLVVRTKPFTNTGQIKQLNGGVVQVNP